MIKNFLTASFCYGLLFLVIVVCTPWVLCKDISSALQSWWFWVRIEWSSCVFHIRKFTQEKEKS